jgi:hypothetical protein
VRERERGTFAALQVVNASLAADRRTDSKQQSSRTRCLVSIVVCASEGGFAEMGELLQAAPLFAQPLLAKNDACIFLRPHSSLIFFLFLSLKSDLCGLTNASFGHGRVFSRVDQGPLE